MKSYASIEDLEFRYRKLDDEEKARALALLEDASAYLNSEFRNYGKKMTGSDEELLNLKIVCCNLVRRVMSADNDAGITQSSTTVGSFTESFTYGNNDGSVYFRESDRRLLGLRKGRTASVRVE